jgi:CDP-glucose 4,6-dehydratase
MAAQALVRRSVADPIGTFSTNVMGTANLLDVLRSTDVVTDILVVTSDKVYANANTGEAFGERACLGGRDPYSGSKAACEHVAYSYAATYFTQKGVRLATARAGNVLGGGDTSEDRVIPDCVRALESHRPLIVRNPHAVRPWQHVLDCLNGYLVYTERLANAGGREGLSRSLNFGPSSKERYTVGELVSLFYRCYGRFPEVIHQHGDPSVEMETLVLDSSRAEMELGWRCILSQREAVAWTAAWYSEVARSDVSSSGIREIMARQISRFEERALRQRKRCLAAAAAH